MRIASLSIFPVKSTTGLARTSARVEPGGLRDDRRWMVVDSSGHRLTARKHRRMLHIVADPDTGGGLLLSYRGLDGPPPLYVPPPSGPPDVPVDLSRLDSATSTTPEADGWMSAAIGRPVRLVWLDDPARRPVGAGHGGEPGDHLSLADAGPLLVTSRPSLDRLNDWMAEAGEPPIEMERFRPNIVVDGDLSPFCEDEWRRVRIGELTFRFGELCDRCVLPTIDPVTLASSKEPTRTLARYRRWDGHVWFGVRLIPEASGRIAVGDSVESLEAERTAAAVAPDRSSRGSPMRSGAATDPPTGSRRSRVPSRPRRYASSRRVW